MTIKKASNISKFNLVVKRSVLTQTGCEHNTQTLFLYSYLLYSNGNSFNLFATENRLHINKLVSSLLCDNMQIFFYLSNLINITPFSTLSGYVFSASHTGERAGSPMRQSNCPLCPGHSMLWPITKPSARCTSSCVQYPFVQKYSSSGLRNKA